MSVSLGVLAHTNVGKTTLVRTLLKRDIGEVADRPHVTEDAERHTLLETPSGDELFLWDTPGFGDSVRLLRRLEASGNPLGWFQSQVWDRLVDRPFFCSQRAMRNARDESDVVLYLVNAAEDASAAAYVEAELRILRWMGKPILILLNQVGPPGSPQAERADEARWEQRLAAHVQEGAVITLDAFARCWVREEKLLRAAAGLLEGAKRDELERLREAWRARNLEVFGAAMRSMAGMLAATAVDSEKVPERIDAAALAQRVRRWVARARDERGEDPAVESAMQALTRRLGDRVRDDTDRLIAMHGLAGRAKQRIFERTAGQFEVALPADVAGSGLVAGLLTGAAGGLAADLSAGGLTLGAGMLIGALLGALGGGGAARAYNVLQGQEDGRVRWTGELLTRQAGASLLRYLAVAHFGRGRGEWAEGESPSHWPALVASSVEARAARWQAGWSMATSGAPEAEVAAALAPALEESAREILLKLYPDAASVFGGDVRNILFLCTGNSARSILAEAFTNELGRGRFRAFSAGSHPAGKVNPHALDVLREAGLPTAGLRSKAWDEFARPGAPAMDFIITVCDNAAGEACPIWPGKPATAHWGVPDPAAVEGSDADKRAAFREAARVLRKRIELLAALDLDPLDAASIRSRLREIGNAG